MALGDSFDRDIRYNVEELLVENCFETFGGLHPLFRTAASRVKLSRCLLRANGAWYSKIQLRYKAPPKLIKTTFENSYYNIKIPQLLLNRKSFLKFIYLSIFSHGKFIQYRV